MTAAGWSEPVSWGSGGLDTQTQKPTRKPRAFENIDSMNTAVDHTEIKIVALDNNCESGMTFAQLCVKCVFCIAYEYLLKRYIENSIYICIYIWWTIVGYLLNFWVKKRINFLHAKICL